MATETANESARVETVNAYLAGVPADARAALEIFCQTRGPSPLTSG